MQNPEKQVCGSLVTYRPLFIYLGSPNHYFVSRSFHGFVGEFEFTVSAALGASAVPSASGAELTMRVVITKAAFLLFREKQQAAVKVAPQPILPDASHKR